MVLKAYVAEQKPGCCIVSAVKHKVRTCRKRPNSQSVHIGHESFNTDSAIYMAKLVGRGNRLRQYGKRIRLVEQHLPLQIAWFDEIAVGQPNLADARPNHMLRKRSAERADPDDQHASACQLSLALLANRRKSRLSGITVRPNGISRISHKSYSLQL
jgi:hypothetical protein